MIAVTYAAGINTAAVFQLSQSADSLVAWQKFIDRVSHGPFTAIQRFGRSRCERENEFLALELVSGTAV